MSSGSCSAAAALRATASAAAAALGPSGRVRSCRWTRPSIALGMGGPHRRAGCASRAAFCTRVARDGTQHDGRVTRQVPPAFRRLRPLACRIRRSRSPRSTTRATTSSPRAVQAAARARRRGARSRPRLTSSNRSPRTGSRHRTRRLACRRNSAARTLRRRALPHPPRAMPARGTRPCRVAGATGRGGGATTAACASRSRQSSTQRSNVSAAPGSGNPAAISRIRHARKLGEELGPPRRHLPRQRAARDRRSTERAVTKRIPVPGTASACPATAASAR